MKSFFCETRNKPSSKKMGMFSARNSQQREFLERSGGSHLIKLSNAVIRNGISKMYPKVKIRQPKPLIGPSKQSFYIH